MANELVGGQCRAFANHGVAGHPRANPPVSSTPGTSNGIRLGRQKNQLSLVKPKNPQPLSEHPLLEHFK